MNAGLALCYRVKLLRVPVDKPIAAPASGNPEAAMHRRETATRKQRIVGSHSLVPTLRVGTHVWTLRVPNPCTAERGDARSHAERGNEKKLWIVGIFVCWILPLAPARADAPPPLCLEQLAAMSWCDLEQLYRQAAPGLIPCGYARGRAIYCPCAPLTPMRAKVSQTLWHGKHFCPDAGMLVNQWCLGTQAVRARVCFGDSWLDGKPSIVMDYRGVSHIWKDVRDEIREVAPGLYLGLMYRCKSGQPRMKIFFALEMTPACR